MDQKSDSQPDPQRNEVEVEATFEDLDEGITFEINLTKEDNRLVVHIRDDYQFST
jgi:hypothetical protein